MDRKKIILLLLGAIAGVILIFAILYMRQRLFTKTEPIVLAE
jgi:hypothetical protein